MKNVRIYTTKTCGYCRASKEFMDSHNVAYSEVDVGSDSEKAREMIEKSGQMGVPVLIIGEGATEEIIVGFDREKIASALGINT